MSVRVNTYGNEVESDASASRITEPPEFPDPMLALELDICCPGSYGALVCAKLSRLDVGDKSTAFLLFGVVGAVRYVPARVPCDEHRTAMVGRCLRTRDPLLLELPDVDIVPRDMLLSCLWSDS